MNSKTTLAIIVLAAACAGCQRKDAKTGEATVPAVTAEAPIVFVRTVEKETIPQDAVYASSVQANAINNIAPQSGNRIRKINVEIGDFVNQGQILAEMDKVQLEQAELKLKNDEAELARVRQLLQEGGISQSDFDQLQLAFNVSQSSFKNLEDNTILRSPISGVVSARNYDRGDMYTMGQPIFTVQQITPVKILVGVSESDYTKVKRGDKATVTVDALPGKEFSGTVIRLYPTMDAATHTFMAEVQVRNEKRELRPGMYARVTLDFGATQNFAVPDAAIVKQQGSGQRSVYVYDGDTGTVLLRNVELGRHFDGKYEIVSGLDEGEQVVVKGQTALKSGIKVEVR
ncbi:MAG: efflux RND transporter periplasmic adaptor subunit [Bacteroidales bacterium]|nr:efflux RND transporter periplasmic adaptor subunit [Bacteroidales bacterium]